ncbi:winged helix-turn-helix domain-containing protein [Neptuniibacter sp. PT8_73]|uniref:winged helix-turn-helix domain-containing protein n=1 Tax=unclassified Neptuniibacter TaxID=2630693 RepID=UPI0039F4B801
MEHYYKFYNYEVHPQKRSLYINNKLVPLGSRAFDVLLALIERNDRIVTKQELLELVWPDLYVEENNLQVQVSTLRKVLKHKVLTTIPGQGYRFVSELEIITPAHQKSLTQDDSNYRLNTLPIASRNMIGREKELNDLVRLIKKHNLVSITGATGIGKSTLAYFAAHNQFTSDQQTTWVDLANVQNQEEIQRKILTSLNIKQVAHQNLSVTKFLTSLSKTNLYLFLDNIDNLIEPITQIAWAINTERPNIHLIITSQTPLKIEGERLFKLSGLSTPKTGTSISKVQTYGSIRLLIDQAQAFDRSFRITQDNIHDIISLCQKLEGMPLTIKLAAARLPLLGPKGILNRLDEHLSMFGNFIPGLNSFPQKSLLESLESSYQQLNWTEQKVLIRCSLFKKEFSLEQAILLCTDQDTDKWNVINALEGLVSRSFVETGKQSFRCYIPSYALEYSRIRLNEEEDKNVVLEKFSIIFSKTMEQAYDAYWLHSDQTWLEEYSIELNNIRQAISWSLSRNSVIAITLISSSTPLLLTLGLRSEAISYYRQADSILGLDRSTLSDLNFATYWLERCRVYQSTSIIEAHSCAEKALTIFQKVNDKRGIFLSLIHLAISTLCPQKITPIWERLSSLELSENSPRMMAERIFAEIHLRYLTREIQEVRHSLESLQLTAMSSGLIHFEIYAIQGLADLKLNEKEFQSTLNHCKYLKSLASTNNDAELHSTAIEAATWLLSNKLEKGRNAIIKFLKISKESNWECFEIYSDLFPLLAVLENRSGCAARLIGYSRKKKNSNFCPPYFWTVQARKKTDALLEKILSKELTNKLIAEGKTMHRDAAYALIGKQIKNKMKSRWSTTISINKIVN